MEGFPGVSVEKITPANRGAIGNTGLMPDWEDPPEKEMTTDSSTLAWEIPCIKEPGRL